MTRREALEILGLDSEASLDEARNAYRKLARIYHPDKNSAPNATAMFRIIHDAYEFILNNDVYQQMEATTRQRQAEAEAARKRAEEESARRYAETKAQRQRTEEARHRAKEAAAKKAKKKAEWKNTRNFYITLLPINIVLYLSTLGSKIGVFDEIGLFSVLFYVILFLLGTSINSVALYREFCRLTNYLIDPTRFNKVEPLAMTFEEKLENPTKFGTDRVKPYKKQFIALYATYTIVYAIYAGQIQDDSPLFVISVCALTPVLGWFAIRLAGSIIFILAKFLKWLSNKWFAHTVRRRK